MCLFVCFLLSFVHVLRVLPYAVLYEGIGECMHCLG